MRAAVAAIADHTASIWRYVALATAIEYTFAQRRLLTQSSMITGDSRLFGSTRITARYCGAQLVFGTEVLDSEALVLSERVLAAEPALYS